MDHLEEFIRRALIEDCAFDDITSRSTISPERKANGILLLKQDGIIAGLPFLPDIFRALDPLLTFTPAVQEGSHCAAGTTLAHLNGLAHALLAAERTALNLLQHLSGIATLTSKCVAKTVGTTCKILDTRKTLPGYRELQKYAVLRGGGTNHRMHLADCVLIKNNHLALASLKDALLSAFKLHSPDRVQIEVATLEQLREALALGARRILLDNMTPQQVRTAVRLADRRAFLEASGGINLSNISEYAKTGIDAISIGALTHSAPALDISLRIS